MSNILVNLLGKLGISEAEMPNAIKNMQDFANQVRHIESDDNPMAAAKTTTAKGVYQFTDDSVDTGKQRMLNMGYPEEYVSEIKGNPQEWTDEQADSMFFGNIFAQEGSDPFLKEIAMGNQKARRDAYYQFHHTNPDEATTERTEKFMPVDSQPVDDTMMNYANNNPF